jgi:hypothetical protein
MAFLLQCNGCGTATVTADARDPDAAVVCPPESDCCKTDHHHGEAAACAGGHAACPTPDDCPVFGDQHQPEPDEPGAPAPARIPCPGGHCGPGVAGCNVCRPITITALAGSLGITAGQGA